MAGMGRSARPQRDAGNPQQDQDVSPRNDDGFLIQRPALNCRPLGDNLVQPRRGRHGVTSAGSPQAASASSSSSSGSPEIQPAANDRITKCRSTLFPDRAQPSRGSRRAPPARCERGLLLDLADHASARFRRPRPRRPAGCRAPSPGARAADDQHLAVAKIAALTARKGRVGIGAGIGSRLVQLGPCRGDARRTIACADAMPSPPRRKRCGSCSATRAAEFPAALQRCADPADPDCAACRRPAAFRAGALGPVPGLGEGPKDVHVAVQGARRDRQRQARIQECNEASALPDPGRRLLRMEAKTRRRSGPMSCARRTAVRLRSPGSGKSGPDRTARRSIPRPIVTTEVNKTLIRSISACR